MKIQTICAISVIFLLSLNISVARAADGEVKCAAVLDIEIDEKKGEMEYHANLLISNSSNEIVTDTTYSLLSKDGKTLGGGSVSSYLMPNESETTSTRRAASIITIEWSEDPETRIRQEIQFENIRQEKENALNGAYCELVGFAKSGWIATPK
jgi:hypothetical protein